MSDLHERCRKAEAEVAHLQRELTYAKNSFEAQKFLRHREWERAVQAERERDEWRASSAGYGTDAEQYKHERDEARAEVERLTNKLNTDSQHFELECRRAQIEQLERERDEARSRVEQVLTEWSAVRAKYIDAQQQCDTLRALLRDFYERWQGEHLCNLKSYRHCESCQQFKARLDAFLAGRKS